jgi:hypothetical protein
MIKNQLSASGLPEDTTPHANAHIGGNHVMGFKSSATVEKAGRCMCQFFYQGHCFQSVDTS